MTASYPFAPSAPRRRGPFAAIAVGFVGAVASLGLILAGLVFFALAIAFPIAVPLASSMGLAVTAHDATLAGQLAGLTPVFIALSVVAFGASLGVLALTVRSIEPRAA